MYKIVQVNMIITNKLISGGHFNLFYLIYLCFRLLIIFNKRKAKIRSAIITQYLIGVVDPHINLAIFYFLNSKTRTLTIKVINMLQVQPVINNYNIC